MKLKNVLVLLLLALLLLLPAMAMADETMMWVSTPNHGAVNLRDGPSVDDDVIAHVPHGALVTMHNDILGSTYKHVTYKGHTGYIAARYLTKHEPKHTNPPKPTPKPTAKPETSIYDGFTATLYLASVTPSTPSSYVNLRWGPSKSTPTQTIYYAGQTLLVIAENGTWSQVYDINTHVGGFMMSSFLRYASEYDDHALGAQQ